MAPPDPAAGGWHWDKRVPIALIITLVLQTGGIVWWASGLSSRVTTLEERVFSTSDNPGRIIKVETQVEALLRSMARVEDKLDKILDKP